jgi:hypothetical protein
LVFNLRVAHPKYQQELIELANLKESSAKDLMLVLTDLQLEKLNERKQLVDVLDFSYACKNSRLVKYKLIMELYELHYPSFGLNLFLEKSDLSND